MKRLWLYLIGVSTICVLIIGTWVYLRYVRSTAAPAITYTATHGPLSEIVKSRGTVTANSNLQLGFPFSGIVRRRFVAEGATVKAGTALLSLDATSKQAQLAQLEANLAKLLAGSTAADLAVYQSKFSDAQVAAVDAVQDAYSACDDAVRNQVDRFISGGRSTSPLVDPELAADTSLKTEVQQKRVTMETLLAAWNTTVSVLSPSSDLGSAIAQARDNVNQVKFFLDRVAFMVNSVPGPGMLTQATLDGYKAAVSTARSEVSTAASSLSTAETGLNTTQSQLVAQQAPARPEDVAVLRAQITAAQQDVANAVLRAPVAGTVVKFNLYVGEQYVLGTNAVAFYSPDLKITSDLSELDIGRIPASGSSAVTIVLDAFPDMVFSGHVVSVDPQEVVESGDTYYRVNIAFDHLPPEVRSGMSADLNIIIQTKNDVVHIPAFLVTTSDDGTKHVTVMRNGAPQDQVVTVGISDGDQIEVISGLSAGEIIAAPAD